MKKIILMLLFAVGLIAFNKVEAQRLLPDAYYYEYTGLTTDYVGSGVLSLSKPIEVNKGQALYYTIGVKLQELNLRSHVRVILQGKELNTDPYSNLDTVIWYGTGADTSFKFIEHTTRRFDRFFNVKVDTLSGNTGRTKLVHLKEAFRY